MRRYCLHCGNKILNHFDSDTNGTPNCVCARCRAEYRHDYGKEPGAFFSRSGERLDTMTAQELYTEACSRFRNGSRKAVMEWCGLDPKWSISR
jgi:hypothetical protein